MSSIELNNYTILKCYNVQILQGPVGELQQ